LLSKPGLKGNERQQILRLMRQMRVLTIDSAIAAASAILLQKYAGRLLRANDALIAATAWTKRLPLLTRNRKHYEFIEEIQLADLP
jgi:predicted nucleic acid-binding protein